MVDYSSEAWHQYVARMDRLGSLTDRHEERKPKPRPETGIGHGEVDEYLRLVK